MNIYEMIFDHFYNKYEKKKGTSVRRFEIFI